MNYNLLRIFKRILVFIESEALFQAKTKKWKEKMKNMYYISLSSMQIILYIAGATKVDLAGKHSQKGKEL